MVPFAGYAMPVQYEGIMAEHLWTRENAGLFDVSHMGQLLVRGSDVDAALETLMPGDFQALADMKPKYSLLLADDGGIIDDLMATRRGEDFYVVVNGATKHGDIDVHARAAAATRSCVDLHEGAGAARAPGARRRSRCSRRSSPGSPSSASCRPRHSDWNGQPLWISRSGYTGEDGFEISVPAATAPQRWPTRSSPIRLAKPIGLGARDSLRLEAGLPLYGHDIDRETTPVMAGLTFAINKRRRAEGGFPGFERIIGELENGPGPEARRPAGRRPPAGPRRRADPRRRRQ